MSTSTSRPADIDRVIHERARLMIMSFMAARGDVSFVELKEHLQMTDGNLSVHLRILEEAGYVAIEKSFVERKPRTTVNVTKKGRAAFKAYIDALEQIIHRVKG